MAMKKYKTLQAPTSGELEEGWELYGSPGYADLLFTQVVVKG